MSLVHDNTLAIWHCDISQPCYFHSNFPDIMWVPRGACIMIALKVSLLSIIQSWDIIHNGYCDIRPGISFIVLVMVTNQSTVIAEHITSYLNSWTAFCAASDHGLDFVSRKSIFRDRWSYISCLLRSAVLKRVNEILFSESSASLITLFERA